MPSPSSLQKKIFMSMVLTGLVPILILSFQNHYFGKHAIEKLEKDHLHYALKSRMLWLREWLRHSKKEFNRIAAKVSIDEGKLSPENISIVQTATETLLKGHATYESLTIYDQNWKMISSYPKNLIKPLPLSEHFKKIFSHNSLLVAGEPAIAQNNKITILPFGQSLVDRNGHVNGYIVGELNISHSLKRILGDTSDLDERGTLYLVTADGKLLFNSACSSLANCDPTTFIFPPQLLEKPHWQLKKRFNSKGVHVFSIAADIPEMNWILIAEIDKMQVLKEYQKHILLGGTVVLCMLFLILCIAHQRARKVSHPLDELANVSQHIAKGNFQERLPEFQEEYLNEVGRSFNAMLDALEKSQKDVIQTISLSTVGKLSSSIVHEMRNPLSSVKINLQALARKVKDDPAYFEMATIALMQVKRLESMFTDLLNFSKPIKLTPQTISFTHLTDEILKVISTEAADKNISIEINDNLANRLMKVDKQHITLALLNLVGNALQWSPPDSSVSITASILNTEGFIITVSDCGPGLRDDQLVKLFQPFYTTRETGTGLGLANVKKIVEFHGGTVTASNNAKGGAQFSMIFKGRLLR